MPNETPQGGVSAVEATNARLLNQNVGALIESMGGGNADLVAALNSIASAITASIIGGSTGTTANRVLISKGTGARALQASQVALSPSDTGFAASAIAFAATQRVLGRNTSGAGTGEEVTLTQVLDWISASVARGDILRRGASAWERLALGTSGKVLTSDGTDPVWSTPAVQVITNIAQGSISGGTTNLDIALGSHDMVEIDLMALEPSNDAAVLDARYSQDGGSTYLSGASDYAWAFIGNATAVTDPSDSEISVGTGTGNAAGEQRSQTVRIYRPAASSFSKTMTWYGGGVTSTGTYVENQGWGVFLNNTNAVDHVRFLWSAGTYDAGYYAARGYSFTA